MELKIKVNYLNYKLRIEIISINYLEFQNLSFKFVPVSILILYSKNSNHTTYTELTLYFWIFTHKDMPKYKEKLRNDILVRELKKLFSEIDNMGISKNHLIYNRIYNSVNDKYIGRLMAFKITDWSDAIRGVISGK